MKPQVNARRYASRRHDVFFLYHAIINHLRTVRFQLFKGPWMSCRAFVFQEACGPQQESAGTDRRLQFHGIRRSQPDVQANSGINPIDFRPVSRSYTPMKSNMVIRPKMMKAVFMGAYGADGSSIPFSFIILFSYIAWMKCKMVRAQHQGSSIISIYVCRALIPVGPIDGGLISIDSGTEPVEDRTVV